MGEAKASAVITAAGSGKRFGDTGLPKQFAPLAGEPLLSHSIRSFSESDTIGEIIVVVPEDFIEFTRNEIVDKYGYDKAAKIVPGGEERQHSVEKGFRTLTGKPDVVLVHDGVRPFIRPETIDAVTEEARRSGAAICAVPATDTVKQSSPERFIDDTLDRNGIWLAQTPQGFRYDFLEEAFRRAREDGYLGTDESLLVERTGIKVKLVEGSHYNIKITTKEDIVLGELMIKEGLV